MVNLWLDDVRPAPIGWLWVKTVEEAKALLQAGEVIKASLDHDLGACEECLSGKSFEQWMVESNFQQTPNCEHFGTGYTLVCWMEETGFWPQEKPTVHSANPAGRKRMLLAIDREWERRQDNEAHE